MCTDLAMTSMGNSDVSGRREQQGYLKKVIATFGRLARQDTPLAVGCDTRTVTCYTAPIFSSHLCVFVSAPRRALCTAHTPHSTPPHLHLGTASTHTTFVAASRDTQEGPRGRTQQQYQLPLCAHVLIGAQKKQKQFMLHDVPRRV